MLYDRYACLKDPDKVSTDNYPLTTALRCLSDNLNPRGHISPRLIDFCGWEAESGERYSQRLSIHPILKQGEDSKQGKQRN
jgi:hypothetical protein